MATPQTESFVNQFWDTSIIPALSEYIKIPNCSPAYDPTWKTNGNADKAVDLLVDWVKKQNVPKLELEVVRLPERTALIFMTLPATGNCSETVLLYGHMDKQPPLPDSWEPGLGPYTPVLRDGKLYGRGGADDGYSTFAAICAIKALEEQKIPHGRCVIMIEGCEESGSPDLPYYVEHLQERIGTPTLIVCLDSGCGNYEQLWLTTSLRGLLNADLKVHILQEGSHSGHASGIVPSSFRIARSLLNRIEDPNTGEIIKEFHHPAIPGHRLEQTKKCASALGKHIYEEFKFVPGAQPVSHDLTELLLNRTWRPMLEITGADGFFPMANAGNVLRTHTSLRLSLRLPPGIDENKAKKDLEEILSKNPPYGAKVECDCFKAAPGWESPALAPWLESSLTKASNFFYSKPPNFIGEGGSIPFMGMLGKKFPAAQFVITGVLGPQSNAHSGNEMLHVEMGKKITACVSAILADHFTHFAK